MYLKYNPEQRFYYMSKQSKEDVLIFKNFDSSRDVKAICEYNEFRDCKGVSDWFEIKTRPMPHSIIQSVQKMWYRDKVSRFGLWSSQNIQQTELPGGNLVGGARM